jgi:hypothetical protein
MEYGDAKWRFFVLRARPSSVKVRCSAAMGGHLLGDALGLHLFAVMFPE